MLAAAVFILKLLWCAVFLIYGLPFFLLSWLPETQDREGLKLQVPVGLLGAFLISLAILPFLGFGWWWICVVFPFANAVLQAVWSVVTRLLQTVWPVVTVSLSILQAIVRGVVFPVGWVRRQIAICKAIRRLNQGAWEQRLEAAKSLERSQWKVGRHTGKKACALFFTGASAEGDASIKKKAYAHLRAFGWRPRQPELLARMADELHDDRLLTECGEAAVPVLKGRLRSGRDDVSRVLDCLAQIATPHACDVLFSVLAGPYDESTRRAAANRLKAAGWSPQTPEETVEWLLAKANDYERAAALGPTARARIARELTSAYSTRSEKIAIALAKADDRLGLEWLRSHVFQLADPEALQLLQQRGVSAAFEAEAARCGDTLLNKADHVVRAKARHLLSPHDQELLVAMMASPRLSDPNRLKAARALEVAGWSAPTTELHEEWLWALSRTSEDFERQAAIGPTARSRLAGELTSKHSGRSEQIAVALMKVGDQRGVDWLKDNRRLLSRSVLRAIQEHGVLFAFEEEADRHLEGLRGSEHYGGDLSGLEKRIAEASSFLERCGDRIAPATLKLFTQLPESVNVNYQVYEETSRDVYRLVKEVFVGSRSLGKLKQLAEDCLRKRQASTTAG